MIKFIKGNPALFWFSLLMYTLVVVYLLMKLFSPEDPTPDALPVRGDSEVTVDAGDLPSEKPTPPAPEPAPAPPAEIDWKDADWTVPLRGRR